MMSSGNDRQPSWNEVENEANALVSDAEDAGLTLRLLGSVGVRMHCSDSASVMDQCGRGPKDIDLIGFSKQRKKLRQFFEGRGYELDRDVLVAMEGARFCLTHPATGMDLDVFFDELEFCHTIDLSKRMSRTSPTVPVEDLLLQKLQVHDLTASDALDSLILLSVHEVVDDASGGEEINASYVASLLAKDWGFHRSATENLDRIDKAAGQGSAEGLGPAALDRMRRGMNALREAIESAPKSRGWRLRARVGDRVQWWNEVSDRELTY